MGGASLLQPTERHDLLVRLLRFDPQPEQITALRFELLGDIRALDALMTAASRRQLVSAAVSRLKLNGILLPRPACDDEQETIATQIGRLDAELSRRRAVLTQALQDIVTHLNSAGVVPLILKGSMSLVSGEPDWRFQRDIDFAVDPAQASATVAALIEAGFVECANAGARPHHLRPMERAGLPATIEPHVKLAGARARAVLPDQTLLQTATVETWRGLEYRQLSDAGSVLHGLAHHHFQNRGYIYGTLSLKGLLEFASAVCRLDAAAVSQLAEITRPRARLSAGLDLWCALARRVLNVSLPQGLETGAIAERDAEIVAQRYLSGHTVSPVRGVQEHLRLTRDQLSKGATGSGVLQTVLDGCHSAVWLDYQEQRCKASGIIDA
ncbi:MAG: nucleotidyltransferase family protein [Pseudomonadota bacterium]